MSTIWVSIASQSRQGAVDGASVPIPAAAAGGSVLLNMTVTVPAVSAAGTILAGIRFSFDGGATFARAAITAKAYATQHGAQELTITARATVPFNAAPSHAMAFASIPVMALTGADLTFFDASGNSI